MRLSNLDLNLLIVLDVLLESGSVSRTAQQLLLTQPAVSNALSRLRSHFDDDLFVMAGRNLTPTPLANNLRDEVRQLIALSRHIVSKRGIFDPASTERHFSIVCSDNVALVLFAPLVRLLADKAPGVSLQYVQSDAHAIAKFNSGGFDFLISPRYMTQPGANCELILSDEYCVIADAANERYNSPLGLHEYRNAKVISPRIGDLSHLCLAEEYLIEQGVVAQAQIICAGFLPLAPLVAGTPYIALAHRTYAVPAARSWPIKIIEPEFELPKIEQVLMWRGHLDGDPAAKWLRSALLELSKQFTL